MERLNYFRVKLTQTAGIQAIFTHLMASSLYLLASAYCLLTLVQGFQAMLFTFFLIFLVMGILAILIIVLKNKIIIIIQLILSITVILIFISTLFSMLSILLDDVYLIFTALLLLLFIIVFTTFATLSSFVLFLSDDTTWALNLRFLNKFKKEEIKSEYDVTYADNTKVQPTPPQEMVAPTEVYKPYTNPYNNV